MSAVYTIIILALFALGMPVAFVLLLGGVLGMLFFLGGPAAFTQIPVIAYKTLDDFVLVAVPLYILMSEILLKGRVGNGLFELGSKWLGHLPGGIGVATIFACAIFAAISGSSVATAEVVLPEVSLAEPAQGGVGGVFRQPGGVAESGLVGDGGRAPELGAGEQGCQRRAGERVLGGAVFGLGPEEFGNEEGERHALRLGRRGLTATPEGYGIGLRRGRGAVDRAFECTIATLPRRPGS